MQAPGTLVRAIAPTVALAIAVVSGAASAAQFDYTVSTGIEHSDNINLSATDPISQNVLIPDFDFTLAQQGSTVQANVAGNLEYRNFLGNAFNDQLRAVLSGQANWTIAPQRLDLNVQDYAGVQPVDSLASNAPGNQQQTNVFSIGPILHFRLGDTLLGQAELHYIDSYAEKTKEFNSRRGQAAFRILKDLDPTDQLSANVETQHVDFYDGAGGPNYTRTDLFGRYVSKLAHLDVDASLGWSELNFDGAPTASDPLARLTLGWRATPRTSFSVIGAYQYSDAAEDLMTLPGQLINGSGGGINPGNAVIGSQVYLERSLEGTYAFTTERFTLRVSPLYRRLSYLNNTTFDQTGHGGSIDLDYRLSGTFTLSVFANEETLTYQTLTRRDETIAYGLSLANSWTSHWGWRFSLLHNQRNSTALDQGYRENEIYFGVVFKR